MQTQQRHIENNKRNKNHNNNNSTGNRVNRNVDETLGEGGGGTEPDSHTIKTDKETKRLEPEYILGTLGLKSLATDAYRNLRLWP